MKWKLAHRKRGTDDTVYVIVEAPDSGSAIDQPAADIADDRTIVSIRALS